jgi:Flp pilus assembly protein TadB
MYGVLIKILGLAACIVAFGFLALYSNKIINAMTTSKNFVDKWYYKLFGRTLKNIQISFSRTADLNKYSFAYKVYHFFDELVVNLDLKKDNVTVTGLLVFISAISFAGGLVLANIMNSMGLLLPITAAFFYLIVVIFRFMGLMRYEQREAEIMDAVDLLVSDIRGGIYNAILRYKESFHPNIRPFFASFIDDIQNKGYSFKQAMGILNDKLGYNFTDFAQKAVLYEDKADETMEDIFSSIIETNRQRRTLRYINNVKFNELRTQFIVSFILIIGYGVFSALLDPFIFEFLTQHSVGKMLLIADIVVVAFVLSYLASVKAKSL